MKNITVTIKSTNVYVSAIEVKNGEVTVTPLPRVEISGDHLTEKNALKMATKYYTNGEVIPNLVVRAIEHENTVYEMPAEKFIQYATKMEKPEAAE